MCLFVCLYEYLQRLLYFSSHSTGCFSYFPTDIYKAMNFGALCSGAHGRDLINICPGQRQQNMQSLFAYIAYIFWH